MDKTFIRAINYMKRHMNDVEDYAVKLYESGEYTKSQVVNDVVAQFVTTQINALTSDFDISQFSYGSDRVDINSMLNSLGGPGIRVGSLAYVLCVKLEDIIPEDGSVIQDIGIVESYGNECHTLGMAAPDPNFKLSDCYKRYMVQEPFWGIALLADEAVWCNK
jgi:hypothetical protein